VCRGAVARDREGRGGSVSGDAEGGANAEGGGCYRGDDGAGRKGAGGGEEVGWRVYLCVFVVGCAAAPCGS